MTWIRDVADRYLRIQLEDKEHELRMLKHQTERITIDRNFLSQRVSYLMGELAKMEKGKSDAEV